MVSNQVAGAIYPRPKERKNPQVNDGEEEEEEVLEVLVVVFRSNGSKIDKE